jgi:hypothetical protein
MDDPAHTLATVRGVLAAADASADDVVAALAALRHLRDELAGWEHVLITTARAAGVSWVTLAPALGVASRQAAERRYLRLRPSSSGETTAEGRVRAERDRRAGDRAVANWAREHSATLRALAGEVTAATGAGAVSDALADDDAAALLNPLADVRPDLSQSHATLAARVETVTSDVERVRRAAHSGHGVSAPGA